MKKAFSIFLLTGFCLAGFCQQKTFLITASGAVADGKSINTAFIQSAIDKAVAEGGGMVIVPKGQFVTGPLYLKSGVELHLQKDAVLLGSTDRLHYGKGNAEALINANGQHNISITGKGEINGRGKLVVDDVYRLAQAGVLQDREWKVKRPEERNRPKVLWFTGCNDVTVKGVTIKNAAGWVTAYARCNNVTIDSITILSNEYWNNDGIDIVNSKNVRITSSYINSADDAICLKSEGSIVDSCVNIYVADCRLRSSASAFKIGTNSRGGFRNITLKNLDIFDTYRSAVALEAVDGGFLENIDIQNIKAINTGNAIFIKLGHRNKDSNYSRIKNIHIANIYVEVPAGKPDKGYPMEGPLLRYPAGIRPAEKGKVQSVSPWNYSYPDSTAIVYRHNVFPSSITGLPGHMVEDITLENIEIVYEGGGNRDTAFFPADSLSLITEAAAAYPEFSMFGELPAWGLYVRHVNGIKLKNVTLRTKKEDYRIPYIFDDVNNLQLDNVKPGKNASSQNLLQYVQPLSGTAPSSTTAALKHSEAGSEKNANTIPATGFPFGMTQWTPQTRLTENKCVPPYFYKDSMLTGFRGSHWLSGSCTQDYGSFTIMPVTGKLKTSVHEYAVPFSHDQETATPASYKIELPASHLTTEITSTLRCGIMQFTMQQDDSLYLLIMPNSDKQVGFVQVDAATGDVWGYNPVHRIYQGWGELAGFNGWFYIKTEKAIARSGIFKNEASGCWLGFAMKKGEQLRIRIGTSFSNLDGAKKNLQAEIPSWDFGTVLNQAKQVWEKVLSQVTVASSDEKNKRIFYTALYHAMQHPRLFSDVDGTYPEFAGNHKLQKMQDGNYYDDFSMWDIYRAQLPLIEILQPGRSNEFVRSLILKGQQGGWLPIFPCWNSYTAAMIGDHAAAVIASAYAKGIRNYDVNAAYALIRKNAFETPANFNDYKNGMGRRALTSYLKYGFVPMEDSVSEAFHKKEQVSRTLEYGYDDYAVSIMAKELNKTEDYKKLHLRAFNYRNVFDRFVGMVRGKYSTGKWFTPFLADSRQPYITEGTPRQYTFYVPHDPAGLAQLMGGTKFLEKSLDSLFKKNEYWHGNEPGHHIPFLYNYTASPWKTQKQVHNILREEYSDGPGGLSGNDDAGQMSAWYVFAAMGFYPVNPVSGEYILCAPLFDSVTLNLPVGKKLEIICKKQNNNCIYISSVLWNGKLYSKNYITYSQIMNGGRLQFELREQPSTWGSAAADRPGSLSTLK